MGDLGTPDIDTPEGREAYRRAHPLVRLKFSNWFSFARELPIGENWCIPTDHEAMITCLVAPLAPGYRPPSPEDRWITRDYGSLKAYMHCALAGEFDVACLMDAYWRLHHGPLSASHGDGINLQRIFDACAKDGIADQALRLMAMEVSHLVTAMANIDCAAGTLPIRIPGGCDFLLRHVGRIEQHKDEVDRIRKQKPNYVPASDYTPESDEHDCEPRVVQLYGLYKVPLL